jgi:hypothetical protein
MLDRRRWLTAHTPRVDIPHQPTSSEEAMCETPMGFSSDVGQCRMNEQHLGRIQGFWTWYILVVSMLPQSLKERISYLGDTACSAWWVYLVAPSCKHCRSACDSVPQDLSLALLSATYTVCFSFRSQQICRCRFGALYSAVGPE